MKTKFNIGDTVVVKNYKKNYNGCKGTIEDINDYEGYPSYIIFVDVKNESEPLCLTGKSIEKIKK